MLSVICMYLARGQPSCSFCGCTVFVYALAYCGQCSYVTCSTRCLCRECAQNTDIAGLNILTEGGGGDSPTFTSTIKYLYTDLHVCGCHKKVINFAHCHSNGVRHAHVKLILCMTIDLQIQGWSKHFSGCPKRLVFCCPIVGRKMKQNQRC